MAKNKVSEWSSTPANNTDVGGIDINEGCAPSGINNAIRDMMAQIKDMQTGADGDNFVVGGNLTVTGTTTFTGGLAADLPVADGGTGASTASGARTNLGAAASGANSDITSLTGLTTALSAAQGGTGLTAPGTSGNVLTSNGTNWVSSTPSTVTVASTAEAQAGTNNTNMITPLRMREGFNASGTAPVYACRAWVKFNGTGTVAINGSGNVTSITDNGTGNYTVNFTTAIQDANYAAPAACPDIPNFAYIVQPNNYQTTSVGVKIRRNGDHALTDISEISVAIFR